MNISPSTSARPPENVPLETGEPSIPQISGQVKLISNNIENLSSFEQLLEQTFPEVILIKILRMLHPTRQVGHPWQHLLPVSYSLLLQHSAGLTSEENTHALLNAFSVIPCKWQPEAIDAISENFIKRIDNFNTFIAIVDFIIANNTLDGHAFGLLLTQLTGVIGRFTSSDMIPQISRNVLTENHGYSEEMLIREEKNIQLETKLQKAQSIFFFHKVRKIHWEIKYTNTKNVNPESIVLLNKMQQTFVASAKRYRYILLKINQERKALHAAYRDTTMVRYDSSGSQRQTKNKHKNINEKIKTFNENRHHHLNLINRHAFEVFWNLIISDRIELSNDTLEKIQLKLAATLGFLHQQQRHIALYAIMQSKKCCTAVLTALIPSVNADFYQTPHYAMHLIANEIEMQHKNHQDISPVISAIKTHNRKEASNIWWENLESLPDCCRELLRDAPWE